MDESLLVGMLDGVADQQQELQALAQAQSLPITEVGDRQALDEVHSEEGASELGGASIEHAGDVRMTHQRQRLSLRLEASEHLRAVHARLDQLERHPATNRLLLERLVDPAHATFAEQLENPVAGNLLHRTPPVARPPRGVHSGTMVVEKGVGLETRRKKALHDTAKLAITGAGPIEVGRALGAIQLERMAEDSFDLRCSALLLL